MASKKLRTYKKKLARKQRIVNYRIQGTINANGYNMYPRWRTAMRVGAHDPNIVQMLKIFGMIK